MKLLALCSVLRLKTISCGTLTTTVEVGGPLWLDAEMLPFRPEIIRQIRRRTIHVKPHQTVEGRR